MYAGFYPFRYMFVRLWYWIRGKSAPILMRDPGAILDELRSRDKELAEKKMRDNVKMRVYFDTERKFLDEVGEHLGEEMMNRMHAALRDMYAEYRTSTTDELHKDLVKRGNDIGVIIEEK